MASAQGIEAVREDNGLIAVNFKIKMKDDLHERLLDELKKRDLSVSEYFTRLILLDLKQKK